MKKFSLIVSLLTISILLLSACLGTNTQTSENQFQPETAQEQLDATTVVEAVQSSNIELCETIVNEDQKAECKTKVEDQIILDQANEEISLDKCDKITEENTKEKCKIKVENKIQAEEKMNKIRDEENMVEEIIKSGNVEDCKNKLTDETVQRQCEMNYYLDKAKKENDTAYCENIEDEFIKESCRGQLVQ